MVCFRTRGNGKEHRKIRKGAEVDTETHDTFLNRCSERETRAGFAGGNGNFKYGFTVKCPCMRARKHDRWSHLSFPFQSLKRLLVPHLPQVDEKPTGHPVQFVAHVIFRGP